jgi:hypothetical protein
MILYPDQVRTSLHRTAHPKKYHLTTGFVIKSSFINHFSDGYLHTITITAVEKTVSQKGIEIFKALPWVTSYIQRK